MHTVRFTLTQRRKLFAPVPTGDQTQEAKCRGILALTNKTGPELETLLDKPPREYTELLRREYLLCAPATPIHTEADYPAVRAALAKFCATLDRP